MTGSTGTALAAAAIGAALGALGPAVVRRLPEPVLHEDEDPAETARHPEKTPYPALAATSGIALRLAAAAALAAGCVGWALGATPALVAFVLAAVVGVWLAWVDLRVHLLPDRLTGPMFLGCAGVLGAAAALDRDGGALVRAGAGAVALAGFYLLLVLLRPADMGVGDVKLAGILGLLLGWLGWGPLAVGGVLGFLLGGLAGVVLLVGRRVGLRTPIPFGPFMLTGALLAVLLGDAVASAYVGAV